MAEKEDRIVAGAAGHRRNMVEISDFIIKGTAVLVIAGILLTEAKATVQQGGFWIVPGTLMVVTGAALLGFAMMSLASAATAFEALLRKDRSEGRSKEAILKWGGWIFAILMTATMFCLAYRRDLI